MTGDVVQTYFDGLAKGDKFSGSVLLKSGDRRVIESGFGMADQSVGRPNRRETAFQIASVSKQFTAAAVLILEEEGKLSVQDRLPKWISGSPTMWEEVTLHQLLTHTSGLPHWDDVPQLDLFHPVSWDTILSAFVSKPLKFPPGKGWAYSSPAYHLLARVVEAASGLRYREFLRNRIFNPLGMTGTSAGNSFGNRAGAALGYDGNTLMGSFDLDTTGMGAGDIWSTTGDLGLWIEALSHPGRVLSQKSLERTFHNWAIMPENWSVGRDWQDDAYGYGWHLGRVGGTPVRYHSGDNPGYRALDLWIPSSRMVMCLLSNRERTDLGEIALGTLKAFSY